MLRYMLDTNTVIYVLKNRPEKARRAFNAHHGQMCISTVTLMELMYGASVSSDPDRNTREVESFTARLDVLPYNEAAAVHTGEIRADLKRSGRKDASYDSMIAGHARSRGLVVMTNNVKDFKRFDGVRTANWLK
ncbi:MULTISPECIES: tRNA(fMet)-specific endonuclease VapC [unclassified Microbulbifer]|uniref:tRNA(fMet)-specific endonuclease VapC n=1 Tax=unclassified Microbulbifer TaxID=2619833 RepID=UPI0027E402BB|nr:MULTISPECIES: tRNA(fMet)-specific endonuclease VapC [unclassified Microbulbifer]